MRTKEEVRLDLVTAVEAYVYHCKNARSQARTRDTIEYLLCECDAIRAVEKFEPMQAARRLGSEQGRERFDVALGQFEEAVHGVVDTIINRSQDDQNPGATI